MKNELICIQCGKEFSFQQDEQEIYLELRFSAKPRRCKACRGSEKAIISPVKPEKVTYAAICDECGKETQLPFKPKGDKPVYCKECFAKKKERTFNRSEIRSN